jgi:hypothetical protein
MEEFSKFLVPYSSKQAKFIVAPRLPVRNARTPPPMKIK